MISAILEVYFGAIQELRNAMGVGGVRFPGKKRYEDVRFIIITLRWVGGCQLFRKKVLRNTWIAPLEFNLKNINLLNC